MACNFARPALMATTALVCLAPASARAQAAAPETKSAVASTNGKRVYTAADFVRFAPRNALDMLRQVPGFIIREAVEERGYGQASENVLLNGARVSSKSGGATAEIQKIPASNVDRIEIVDATTLDIPGLTGQVANVITKADRKASGQFSWTPEFRAHYTDPIFTRGDVSYSGKAGPVDYTLGLNSNGSRSGAGGPTTIFDPNGRPTEFRKDVWNTHYDYPKLSGTFGVHGPGSSIGNLNLSYNPYFYDYDEVGHRDLVDDVDNIRTIRERMDGWKYEVGGDYQFGLGPGQLKLIGLRKFEHKPIVSTAIFDFSDGSPSTGDKVDQDGRTGEWIARSEYSWKAGSSDWQVSGEYAFNSLDSVTRIFSLDPDGDFEEIPFPAGTGRVQEDRYEVLGTYGRPLTDNLTLQFVIGAEYSKLASESEVASLTRNFFRPKGSLSLAWKNSDDLDLSLKLRRRVGQLDFYDFLASVNLTDDQQNAGNLELVPPQSWEADLEINKKLGPWGNTSLRLFGRLIDDIVDIIPIGTDGESPGNIDHAHRYGLEWKSTFLFDPLGWHGAKLDATVVLQRSRVKDPLTDESRPISDQSIHSFDIDLRHDIPGGPWAWGAGYFYEHYAKTYRLTEVGRLWEGPNWVNVFIENKDVAGLTVRAGVSNILNARSRWVRDVYSGFRDTHPILFKERRNRLIGPIFTFSVRGSF